MLNLKTIFALSLAVLTKAAPTRELTFSSASAAEEKCVDGFYCNNGKNVPTEDVKDFWCDCPEETCEDEGGFSICDDGMALPMTYFDDKDCDCPECEDERTFSCNDGTALPLPFENDNMCDCFECEDEVVWSCGGGSDSLACAAGCPTDPSREGKELHYCPANGFKCLSGFPVPPLFKDDGFCDCAECEDEEDYSCDTCADGCPSLEGFEVKFHRCDYYDRRRLASSQRTRASTKTTASKSRTVGKWNKKG